MTIQCPPGAGSSYYNYKGTHSIILMAVCDAHYRFILVDIVNSSSKSDGGVLSNSAFGQALEAGHLSIPPERALPDTAAEAPYLQEASNSIA